MTAAQRLRGLITDPLPPLADRPWSTSWGKVQHYLMLCTAAAIAAAATDELLVVQCCDPTSDHRCGLKACEV